MLNVDRICSGYPDLPVLFDVSLAVEAGELVSVLGSNASGKSTLLKTILGDVGVSSGEVFFAGERITHASIPRRVAAGITYAPEGRRPLPTLSVRENLVAAAYGIPTRELAEQFEVVHGLFPILAERGSQRAGLLSGGEQQMLAIGRALIPRPRLLMIDELSLGLAPIVVADLYAALRTLCQSGLAVLVAEQFQRYEERHSDRFIVLERGTVVAGDPAIRSHG